MQNNSLVIIHILIKLEARFWKKICMQNTSMEKTMQTKESDGEIIFMYKVIEGVSKSSFGLHVAKLAGIKPSIIKRAKKVLSQLEKSEGSPKIDDAIENMNNNEEIENYNKLIVLINKIQPDEVSPKEALEILYSLKNKISDQI